MTNQTQATPRIIPAGQAIPGRLYLTEKGNKVIVDLQKNDITVVRVEIPGYDFKRSKPLTVDSETYMLKEIQGGLMTNATAAKPVAAKPAVKPAAPAAQPAKAPAKAPVATAQPAKKAQPAAGQPKLAQGKAQPTQGKPVPQASSAQAKTQGKPAPAPKAQAEAPAQAAPKKEPLMRLPKLHIEGEKTKYVDIGGFRLRENYRARLSSIRSEECEKAVKDTCNCRCGGALHGMSHQPWKDAEEALFQAAAEKGYSFITAQEVYGLIQHFGGVPKAKKEKAAKAEAEAETAEAPAEEAPQKAPAQAVKAPAKAAVAQPKPVAKAPAKAAAAPAKAAQPVKAVAKAAPAKAAPAKK